MMGKIKIRYFLWILFGGPGVTSAAPTQVELGSEARNGLEMTVYNANFAVVHDRREVELPQGDINLEFSDVALAIRPQTVSIVSAAKNGFVAHQQNYRFDLINPQVLLERFIGRKLKYSRSLLEDNNFEIVLREGILLSINPEIVQFGDVIEVNPEGTISLPYLPDDLKATPTLVFLGKNKKRGMQDLDVRYHTDGIGWEADYALTLASGASSKAELTGWVTIHNHSGSDFDVSRMRMVAGQVNTTYQVEPRMEMSLRANASADMMPAQNKLADYKIYEYPHAVRLPKNDVTQLQLISAEALQFERTYRFESQVQPYANSNMNLQPVSIWIELANTSKNNLGEPLPAGTIRVYDEDSEDRVEFVGESRIGHIAENTGVKVAIGESFDLSAERVQTSWRKTGDRSAEIGYRIVLKNARSDSVTVVVEEKLPGDWLMISESQVGKKIDAFTQLYDVVVQGKNEAIVEYLVRLNW